MTITYDGLDLTMQPPPPPSDMFRLVQLGPRCTRTQRPDMSKLHCKESPPAPSPLWLASGWFASYWNAFLFSSVKNSSSEPPPASFRPRTQSNVSHSASKPVTVPPNTGSGTGGFEAGTFPKRSKTISEGRYVHFGKL